jgi:uracil-DNA glycosylase
MRTITHTWDSLEFFQGPDFADVVSFLKEEQAQGKHIIPEFANVLKALALTPLERVKVVILGQDPYPNPIHADGLAFSIPEDVKIFPATLNNIFKELTSDVGVPYPKTGNLEKWADQGVLLLNTVLTVNAGDRASHAGKGWEILTTEIINTINEHKENVVFILWGKSASLKARYIDEKRHHIIMSTHPSPLAAHGGFFGSKPFSRANMYLKEDNLEPIEWNLNL